jgi:hypothetical protein
MAKTITNGKDDRIGHNIDRRSFHKKGKLPDFPNITGKNRE